MGGSAETCTPDNPITREEHERAWKIKEEIRLTSGNRLLDLWLKPIEKPFLVATGCVDKPVGELTMPELMSWVYCLGYGGLTGFIIGKMIANLLGVALKN